MRPAQLHTCKRTNNDLGGIFLEQFPSLFLCGVLYWAESSIVFSSGVCPMIQEVPHHLSSLLLHHYSIVQWGEARVANIVVDFGAELSIPH